jgi:AcrR family transcriptional regulator
VGTRERLLESGATLFASRGFLGVGIEELGAQLGLTGPSIYRHFKTKAAILGEMLISVSQSLLDGAEAVRESELKPDLALSQLIHKHIDFALGNADLIKVHERDFANLSEADAKQVRRLQRKYVEIWVDEIVRNRPDASVDQARTMAHAVFGLLNSTPRLRSGQRQEDIAALLHQMAVGALNS